MINWAKIVNPRCLQGAQHRYQTTMPQTSPTSQSSGDQAGDRIFFNKTNSHRSFSSKHKPRATVLTCAILWSCFLQLSTSQTKKPILIDFIFSQPDKLQLCFRPMGNYAASTFTSHVRIPFNYSALLYLQDKMIELMDCCIPDLDRFKFNLDQYNQATLNSTFELYKWDIKQVFQTIPRPSGKPSSCSGTSATSMGDCLICRHHLCSHVVNVQHGADFQA